MSGTSLDGIDAAFLKTDGVSISEFGPSAYRPYLKDEKEILRAATRKALSWEAGKPPAAMFTQARRVINEAHTQLAKQIMSDNRDWRADIIGFHGQTLLHRPDDGVTLQIGDGQSLANELLIPVAYDFRSRDVKAGGEGAPLAPIYHQALVDMAGLSAITAVLNLGGVGNVTIIGGGTLKASDTGPANGPLDQWMQSHGHAFDKGGENSLRGEVQERLIDKWLSREFFTRPIPRSADRYDFDVQDDLTGLSFEDGAATLSSYCVQSAVKTLAQMSIRPDRVILCGGGRHNQAIKHMLASHLQRPIDVAEDYGWDSDMIEAQAFAYLAVRTKRGLPISFPQTTKNPAPMTGGVLVEPMG